MPILEFKCPSGHICEAYFAKGGEIQTLPCKVCGKRATKVDISLPAKRNPSYGIQN